MAQTDGQLLLKTWAEGTGIDLILGNAPSADSGFRILANDGKTVLFQVNQLGNLVAAGLLLGQATKTASYVMSSSDCIIFANAAAGAMTVTLVPAGGGGRVVFIEKTDSTNHVVTVTPAGTDTINGIAAAASILLDTEFSSVMLLSAGSGAWFIVSPVPIAHNLVSVSANYTVRYDDDRVLATSGAGGITVTLPAAAGVPAGWETWIEKIDSGAGALTVARAGADLIEGATSVALANQYDSTHLISDGVSVWYRFRATAQP